MPKLALGLIWASAQISPRAWASCQQAHACLHHCRGEGGSVREFSRQNHSKSTTSRASQHLKKYFFKKIRFQQINPKKIQAQAHMANLGLKLFGVANFSFGGLQPPQAHAWLRHC